MTFISKTLVVFTAFSLIGSAEIRAQSAWLPTTGGSSVTLEAYRFDQPSGNKRANGTTMFLTARIQENANVTFVLELPFIRTDRKTITFSSSSIIRDSRTAFGNPYFGIAIGKRQSSSFTLDLGIRLPVATKNRESALSSSGFDKWEAFAPNLFLVNALIGGQWSAPNSPVSASLRAGPTMLSANERSPDFFIDYETAFWITSGRFTFGSTLSGRIPLTDEQSYQITYQTESGESRPIISGQSEFLIGFTGDIKLGSLIPGVSARFPLQDNRLQSLSSSMHAIYGLNISYLFGSN